MCPQSKALAKASFAKDFHFITDLKSSKITDQRRICPKIDEKFREIDVRSSACTHKANRYVCKYPSSCCSILDRKTFSDIEPIFREINEMRVIRNGFIYIRHMLRIIPKNIPT